MSDTAQPRNCPSWCVVHHDPDEPDAGHLHYSIEETVPLGKPSEGEARVQVTRTDHQSGGQDTYIYLDMGSGLEELPVSVAANLAAALARSIGRATTG